MSKFLVLSDAPTGLTVAVDHVALVEPLDGSYTRLTLVGGRTVEVARPFDDVCFALAGACTTTSGMVRVNDAIKHYEAEPHAPMHPSDT